MDIITIIENYIELNVRHESLEQEVQTEQAGYDYAKIEGDLAYYEKNYKVEKSYNASARSHRENKQKAEKELLEVKQQLGIIHTRYIATIEELDVDQLRETIQTLTAKKELAERTLEGLNRRIERAKSKGDIAYNEHNYEDEREYNRIVSDCYREKRKLEPSIRYYDAFITNLNNFIIRKMGQNIGSGGLGIK